MSQRQPIRRSAAQCAIEEEAAIWFGRCEIGLTPAEEAEFERWLEADPRHGEAMREMDATWEQLDRLKESPRLRARPPRRAAILRFAPILLAAAAAFALAFFITSSRRGAYAQQIAIEAGGMKKIDLPDGSTLHLNGGSRVDIVYSARERRVTLSAGEGHFAVAKDPTRPFVVIAGDFAVKAVGTAFNVRHASEGIEVLVTEGKVQLADRHTPDRPLNVHAGKRQPGAQPDGSSGSVPLLVAGHSALLPSTLAHPSTESAPPPRAVIASSVDAREISRALNWQTRLLEFDQLPLGAVVAEFNRHNSHQLIIADATLAQQPFGGSFRADNLDVFVSLLESRFGIVAERASDTTTLRRAKP